jgi:hypothetical protein
MEMRVFQLWSDDHRAGQAQDRIDLEHLRTTLAENLDEG